MQINSQKMYKDLQIFKIVYSSRKKFQNFLFDHYLRYRINQKYEKRCIIDFINERAHAIYWIAVTCQFCVPQSCKSFLWLRVSYEHTAGLALDIDKKHMLAIFVETVHIFVFAVIIILVSQWVWPFVPKSFLRVVRFVKSFPKRYDYFLCCVRHLVFDLAIRQRRWIKEYCLQKLSREWRIDTVLWTMLIGFKVGFSFLFEHHVTIVSLLLDCTWWWMSGWWKGKYRLKKWGK